MGFLRTAPTKTFFCVVYDYAGNADLSKGYGNPKRKLRVTAFFKEIIKLQFGKITIHFYVLFISGKLSLKNARLSSISFCIPITLAKI